MSRLCIDLCSGLGGFSRAFVDAGWEVITVDYEQKFNPTICASVWVLSAERIEFETSLKSFKKYEKVVILISPPCESWSLASMINGWPREGVGDALRTVAACLDLVVKIQPTYWVMENPRAKLRQIIGKPKMTIFYADWDKASPKPTDLWGTVPLGMAPGHGKRKHVQSYKGKTLEAKGWERHAHWEGNHKSSAEAARVPYGLSQAILEAVA